VRGGAVLAGIDSVNIDSTRGRARPIHTTLLQAGVLIVENLTNLAAVPATGALFTAAPLAFEGLPSCPVRAFATC
jgi:kynurenine formamidase